MNGKFFSEFVTNHKGMILLITNLWFLFISVICLFCAFSAQKSEEHIVMIIDLIGFALNFGLFIIGLYELLKYHKEKKVKVQRLTIKDCFPNDFLNSVLSYFIYNKGAFKYENEDWIVDEYCLVGECLNLNIVSKNEMFKDTIIINRDGTYNFFMNYNHYKESQLTSEELSKVIQLKQLLKD